MIEHLKALLILCWLLASAFFLTFGWIWTWEFSLCGFIGLILADWLFYKDEYGSDSTK